MSLCVRIRKRLRGFALDIAFESQGVVAALGASGCGKSLTLRCIAGLETPDEGYIALNGRVLFDSRRRIDLSPQRRRVGYLFQSYALFPHMTVSRNLALASHERGARAAAMAADMLARFGLSDLADRYPAEMSGGQQQRAALARLLMGRPEALLLDEPFSALDAYVKEGMWQEMAQRLRAFGGDAVLVTHDRDEAYLLAPTLLGIDGGRGIGFGDTRALFRDPRSLALARLTGCKNLSRARRVRAGVVEAIDWRAELHVCDDGREVTHVGVRAHDWMPCDAGEENAVPVRDAQRVEGPFEWSVRFGGDDGGARMWWKVPKMQGGEAAEVPGWLRARREAVLLLRDDGGA